jgi:hypothetical protein
MGGLVPPMQLPKAQSQERRTGGMPGSRGQVIFDQWLQLQALAQNKVAAVCCFAAGRARFDKLAMMLPVRSTTMGRVWAGAATGGASDGCQRRNGAGSPPRQAPV